MAEHTADCATRSVTVQCVDDDRAETQIRKFADNLRKRGELIVLPRPVGMTNEEMPGFVANLASMVVAAEGIIARRAELAAQAAAEAAAESVAAVPV